MTQLFPHWVICIFSYNRPALLRNVLASIESFYPDMDYALFDDGSDDPESVLLLEQVKKKGKHVYIHQPESPGQLPQSSTQSGSKHGGLYELMNHALQYAIRQNYRYAYFIQDDMQFLWRDEKLQERVEEVFSKEECVMCNCSFLQKILKKRIEKRLPQVSSQSYFSFHGNGVADTGIIDLEKAKAINLYFPRKSEDGNGQYWYEKGYRLYWLPFPHLAWTPWPTVFRNKEKQNDNVHVLHPLSVTSIQRLVRNRSYAYLEDYTSTQKRMLKPYWFSAHPGKTNLWKIYIKYYMGIPVAK